MLTQFREVIANMVFPEGQEDRRRLERYVNEDALTGLANRRAFDLAIEKAEADETLAILVFDVNNLGKANKSNGHAYGDSIIKRAAGVFKNATEGIGRAFRYGADEFVVILPEATAYDMLPIMEEAFGVLIADDGTQISLSGSGGNTFAEADEALQLIKSLRKQVVSAYLSKLKAA